MTPQELQIAQLAAEGLSNRNIAERLFLSNRTVGGHLYRIYPKLGVVSRSELRRALAIREREFVMAGRALGMSHFRIVFGQILPNLVSVIVVIATLQVARVIILESFLSFLGLGVQPPTPAWGWRLEGPIRRRMRATNKERRKRERCGSA